MSTLIELPSEDLLSLINQYQNEHIATVPMEALDCEIEQRVYEKLANNWVNGWDFCTTTEFFGDRGTSILIQNTEIDWRPIWDWLVDKYSSIPNGVMINFEVWDHIQNGTMLAGDMLMRRIILANGLYAEIIPHAESTP